MNTQLESLSATRKKLIVTVPQGEIAPFLDHAYQKIGQNARIKGFRPGKVPRNLLDKHYGGEIAYESLNFLITETYVRGLIEHKLTPVAEPKFEAGPIDRNADYRYQVMLEVKPTFDLKPYDGIEIKKKPIEISDDELQAELKRLQEGLAQLTPAPEDAVALDGLVVTLDFTGSVDGKPFPGGKASDHVVEMGKGQFLKEFEDKMRGMKKGEARAIDVTFPSDYFEKSLAGKTAKFDITLKNLHEKTLPDLDDEMAKDIGKESIALVKDEIRAMISKRKEKMLRRDYAEEVKKYLTKNYDFEVPHSLVHHDHDHDHDHDPKGHDPDHHHPSEQEQSDELRLHYVLEAIAAKEGLQVESSEIERRFATLSQVYRRPIAEIRQFYSDRQALRQLSAQILADKALDFIIDKAKMT